MVGRKFISLPSCSPETVSMMEPNPFLEQWREDVLEREKIVSDAFQLVVRPDIKIPLCITLTEIWALVAEGWVKIARQPHVTSSDEEKHEQD